MSNDLSLKDRPYSNDGYSMANIAKLEEEEEEAFKEHEYLMKKLKKRSRAGNIFIDKVADVLSAHLNSDTGDIEYLVEWGYNLKDQLKPTSSMVNGNLFVLRAPMIYKKIIEKTFVMKLIERDVQNLK